MKYLYFDMTREELVNNVAFKSVVKEIKKRFPFIIYVRPDEQFEQDAAYYETFYTIELGIDTQKFFEMYPDFSFYSFFGTRYKENGRLKSFLNDVLDWEDNLSYTPDDLKVDIRDTIDNFVEKIRNTEAIPDEYNLDRNLYGGKYIFE